MSEKKIKYGLPVPYTQKTGHGCGMYCLANLFNESNFLLQISHTGERLYELQQALQDYKTKWIIESLYVNIIETPLAYRDHNYIFEHEYIQGYARPLLLTTSKTGDRRHGILCLHDLSNDLYYIVDSNADRVKAFELDHLLEFYRVIGVEHFSFNDFDGTVCIDKKSLTHIIPLGE